MSQVTIHRADQRGAADYGWLKAKYSFSFSEYYDPRKVHFGVLRVLNNDIIAGGMGLGTHPHENMEIITIPLLGALAHKDNLGNGTVIHAGDIQVMSAGTGIRHSEYNANEAEPCELLQIWIFPNKKNVVPRYDQLTYREHYKNNVFNEILSPDKKENTVWIHQDAWFNLATFDNSFESTYHLNKKSNGCYFFVINGSFEINKEIIHQRDAIGFAETSEINVRAISNDAQILIIEIPLTT